MSYPQQFATLFARTLDLFRDPHAREEQKTQFRALATLLKDQSATVSTHAGRLLVNGTMLMGGGPPDMLAQRLDLHSINEVTIPADPPLTELFELLRLLAGQSGDEDIASRLKANGATKIAVTLDSVVYQPSPPPARAPAAPVPAPAPNPVVASSAPAPRVERRIEGLVNEDTLVLAQEAGATAGMFSPATAATRPSKELLAELQDKPAGPNAGDILAVLGRQLETAMKAHRVEQALSIVCGIVRAEQQVSDATPRRQYSIALKRMYTKSFLEMIAELANAAGRRDDALLVLRRAGEDGVEVLLDLLIAAPTIEERRGLFMALTGMKEGTDQLVHMLGHHQWFVVRNVAELAGELGLEEAVPALAQQLNNEDERVRKAVALALAKIGSRAAADFLRRALRDKSPDVRMQAALGVGGRRSSALAMPLVVAVEEEKDDAVQRELMLALGRIGSAAAVQALIKFAQPGGKLFGRRPSAQRVTAVEGLRLAATPAAVGTLEGLTDDGDKQVREAAEAALTDLKRK